MEKHEIKIMNALVSLKTAHFKGILDEVNKNRKMRKMSPNTLSKMLAKLVETGAVKRIERGRKDITYELIMENPRLWYQGCFEEDVSNSLQLLGFNLLKFPPLFGLLGVLQKLNAEELQKLRANLADAIKMLERFMDTPAATVKRSIDRSCSDG